MSDFLIQWDKIDGHYYRAVLVPGNDAIHAVRKWAQWIHSDHGDVAMVVEVIDTNTGDKRHVRVKGLEVEEVK